MFKYLHQIWHTVPLRKKIIFTVAGILIFRLAAHIPVPGVNIQNLSYVIERNQLLGVFSILTGGGLERFSIVLMGVSPYITASIIIQLLTAVIPHLEGLSKEGEQGQRTLNRYTRFLTIPIGLLQSYGMILLINQSAPSGTKIIADLSILNLFFVMLIVTCGTVFLMWLGELLTEKGIGNGISILIFTGIVADIPSIIGPNLSLGQEDNAYLFTLVGISIFTLLLTGLVVVITEAQRQIPVTYAGRQARGGFSQATSFIPIRVNMTGMIPIIFAVSIITFPGLIANLLRNAQTPWVKSLSDFILTNFDQTSISYLIVYFLLVIAFTYFYVNITFNTEKVAENIQQRGGFIPGIRPGRQTAEYLRKVSNRVTLLGSVFLGVVATLPYLIKLLSQNLEASVPLLVSGAGLLIIVGVVLEIIRQINAQLLMQDYEKLY